MSAFDRRVDPEVREVRRLEVITGALGRRRWSAEAKARIVAESLAPGVVISEVARAAGGGAVVRAGGRRG
jgi:transposase